MLQLETTSSTGSSGSQDVPSIEVAYMVTDSLSIVGQIFIITTYFSIRKKSNSFYAYVACHAFIELPWLITNYLTVFYGDSASASCTAVAFINIFSYISSMIWGSAIAWVIFSALKNKQKIPSLKWHYPVLACSVAFLFCLYALLDHGYGPYSGSGISYCWFNNNASTVTYWVPFILTTLFNLYCYIRSIYIVRKNGSTDATKDFWSLLIFPMIQILCNIGGIVRIIVDSFGITYSVHFEIVYVIVAKSQGLFESIAYGINRGVRMEIARVWCKKRQKKSSVEIVTQNTATRSFNEESLATERLQRNTPLIL